MNNFKPNFFCVPNFIFDENEILKFSHCDLSVFLFCCSKKGSPSNKFNADFLSKVLGFSKNEVYSSLVLCCDYGLISIDDDAGVDNVFDSFVYQDNVKERISVKKSKPKSGYIYVLSNDGFDGFLKIGVTTRSVEKRVSELNKGVSSLTNFKIEYSIHTENAFLIEKKIHDVLNYCRVKENKEFFKLEVSDAINSIKSVIFGDNNV